MKIIFNKDFAKHNAFSERSIDRNIIIPMWNNIIKDKGITVKSLVWEWQLVTRTLKTTFWDIQRLFYDKLGDWRGR